MKLTGINHVSVVVGNMERAVKFYREVLELQEIGIPSTFGPAGARVRWFQLGDQHIHLMPAPEPDTISPRHFAIAVENLEEVRQRLQAKGIETKEDIPIPGADRCFIADTEGNNIELIEWKETYQIVPIDAD